MKNENLEEKILRPLVKEVNKFDRKAKRLERKEKARLERIIRKERAAELRQIEREKRLSRKSSGLFINKEAVLGCAGIITTITLVGFVLYYSWRGLDYLESKMSRFLIGLYSPEKAKELNRLDALIEQYSKKLKDNPKDIETHIELADVYSKKSDTKNMIRQARKIKKLDPDRCESYALEGVAYALDGKRKKGIELLKQAISIKPDIKEIHFVLAGIYAKEREYENAIKECEIALNLDTNFASAYYGLGKIYHEKGDKELAKKNLEKAVGLGHETAKKELSCIF